MAPLDIQSRLFKIVKNKIAGKDHLGHALSEILCISIDAVYRRYRGETALTIQETQKICAHFKISMDHLLETPSSHVGFDYNSFDSFDVHLESYLGGILNSIRQIKGLTRAQILMTVNNGHIFQLMNFPQLVRFRLFFWAKTHLKFKEYEHLKFKHEKINQKQFNLGKEVLQLYNSIESIEIIDYDFLRGFLRQIYYYYQSYLFEDPNYAVFLCERVQMLINHLKEQAIHGKKFIYGTQRPEFGNDISFFLNETSNNDSTIYYTSKEARGIFITHNILNYLHTNDEKYVGDTLQSMQRELKNSIKSA